MTPNGGSSRARCGSRIQRSRAMWWSTRRPAPAWPRWPRTEGAALIVFGSDYRTPPGRVEPGGSAQRLLEGGPVAVGGGGGGPADRHAYGVDQDDLGLATRRTIRPPRRPPRRWPRRWARSWPVARTGRRPDRGRLGGQRATEGRIALSGATRGGWIRRAARSSCCRARRRSGSRPAHSSVRRAVRGPRARGVKSRRSVPDQRPTAASCSRSHGSGTGHFHGDSGIRLSLCPVAPMVCWTPGHGCAPGPGRDSACVEWPIRAGRCDSQRHSYVAAPKGQGDSTPNVAAISSLA